MKTNKRNIVPVEEFNLINITDDYISEYESVREYELYKIEIDGKCPFDDFINVSPKKVSNRNKIFEEISTILVLLIQGHPIPPNRVKEIGSNEFEIRIRRTRLYFFYQPPNNKIIVLGHFNKKSDNQQVYIDKFTSIKKKYLKQIENE